MELAKPEPLQLWGRRGDIISSFGLVGIHSNRSRRAGDGLRLLAQDVGRVAVELLGIVAREVHVRTRDRVEGSQSPGRLWARRRQCPVDQLVDWIRLDRLVVSWRSA